MTHESPRREKYRLTERYNEQVIAQRTAAETMEFLMPYLHPGQRLLDAGCGPGSITVDLAQMVAPGEVVGVDLREQDVDYARELAKHRNLTNVRFQVGDLYALPFPDASFDVAVAHLVLQHLSDPLAALTELRRVLKPDGVIGIADPPWQMFLCYPPDPRIEAFDKLFTRTMEHNGGSPFYAPAQRALLRAAGFSRTEGLARPGPVLASRAVGNPELAQRIARNWLDMLEHLVAPVAIAEGWATSTELENMAAAWREWSDHPDAFMLRPICCALGWV